MTVLVTALAACSTASEGGDSATGEAAPAATEPSAAPASEASTSLAATTSAAQPTTEAAVARVSFAKDIQPIFEQNCTSCHAEGGPGSVHFPLLTAGDTLEDPSYLKAMVSSRSMPPWPAGDGGLAFQHDRRLSDADIAKVVAWVEEGAELDVDPTTAIIPAGTSRPVIDRDRVIPGTPYLGSAAKADDYRCQVYDPTLTEPTFVRGYGIEADQTDVVHHALVFLVEASVRTAADETDAATPEVGWNCPGLPGFPGARGRINQIMSWGPGQDPTQLPDGTGLAMQPGDFFITQIHYHYGHGTESLPADESSLVVDLADEAEVAAAGGTLDPVDLTLYLGPAEIPCSAAETGPLCDRGTAIKRLLELQGFVSGVLADSLMGQCGATVEDFAGMTDGHASSTCDLPATPGQIVSIWGHMHELGDSFRMTLNPGTADELVLLDIPKWDFYWQLDYQPVEDVVLEPGDVIRVECSWDRSKLPEGAEPRYIVWSEGTEDEMCYSQIVTRPPPGA